MVHEQKFKDLSGTCQVSVERRVLHLESEAMRGPDSIPTGGNILSLDFISWSKSSDANIGNFVYFVKNPIVSIARETLTWVQTHSLCLRLHHHLMQF